MRLDGWPLLLFATIAVIAILLLIAVPLPPGIERVDPRTGERLLTPRERVQLAVATGDAERALAMLRDHDLRDPGLRDDVLDATIQALDVELTRPRRPAPEATEEALRRIGSGPALFAMLAVIEHDDSVAAATESLFAGTTLVNPRRGPDAYADVLRRDLAAGRVPGVMRFVRLERGFRERGRGRARIRWLLRGLHAHPGSTVLHRELLSAYVAAGRVVEALAVARRWTGLQPHVALAWEKRAELARWRSALREEAGALERWLELRESPAARERVAEICLALADPDRAFPHARTLAQATGSPAHVDRAAEVALMAGRVDAALEVMLLGPVMEERGHAERYVRVALQDLRFETAVTHLQEMVATGAGPRFERMLEGLYRRLDRPGPLADLLKSKLRRSPYDDALRHEVTSILVALGRRAEACAIVRELASLAGDPVHFLSHLPSYREAGVPDLAGRALAKLSGARMSAVDAARILRRLHEVADDPELRRVAFALLEAFPDDDAVRRGRVALVDAIPDNAARLEFAEQLAARWPRDAELARLWASRASWAGRAGVETRAREHLAALAPDDHDNRFALATLLVAAGKHRDALPHWREVFDSEGPRSRAAPRLADSLFACGRIDEALAILERRARDPRATEADRLLVAAELFARGRFDTAEPYYRAVLLANGNHGLALLRLAQIHVWTNDPRGAIPYLEHRLATCTEDRDLVRFYLGEALWQIRENTRARANHELALAAMRARSSPLPAQSSLIARMLVRLGRLAEAEPIYRRLVAEHPRDAGLRLDWAEALVAAERNGEAMPLVAAVLDRRPDHERGLLLHARLARDAGDHATAAASLRTVIAEHGPSAATYAALANALELTGEWRAALGATRRWLQLQPELTEAARAAHRLDGRLANAVALPAQVHWVGDDTSVEAGAGGSFKLDPERTRLDARIGYASYEGVANVGSGGAPATVSAETVLVEVALCHRFGAAHRIGAGVTTFPGLGGDHRAGAWLELHLEGNAPSWSASVRAHGNEPWRDPIPAAAIEGRSSGLAAAGVWSLHPRVWAGIETGWRTLSAAVGGQGTVRDGHAHYGASLGYSPTDGEPAVPGRWRFGRCPSNDPGPRLDTGDGPPPPPHVAVWLSWRGMRLLDDAALHRIVPVGRRLDYVTVGGRVDRHLARGLGGRIETALGTELHAGRVVWQADGTLAWQPAPRVEVSAAAGLGHVLGRSDSSDVAARLRLQLVWRW